MSTTHSTNPPGPDPAWWLIAGFKQPPTTQELIDCGHPRPDWGINMIQLTEEEKNDFQNYREYEHICMRHATSLYEAVKNFRDSIKDALDDDDIHEVRLRDLDTIFLHKTASDVRLDLYNKGLIDKP